MSSSTLDSGSPERRPERSRTLGRLTRSRLALVGLAIVGLTALVGLLAPVFVTADPVAMDFGALLKGPSRAHLLGTDQFGRDVLARLVWGARLSVSIGAAAVALALVVGVPMGALSGYAGGAVITEQIFAWPGVGQLAVNAIVNRDYPVLQGVILTVALLVTLVNLAVDALYVVLDPRLRLS